MIKKQFLLALLTLTLLTSQMFISDPAFAVTTEPSTESTATPTSIPKIHQPDFLPGPTQGSESETLQDYLLYSAFPKALNIGIGIMGIAAFLGILIAAIQLLTAYGDEGRLTIGKANMKHAILGFLVIIFAYAMVSIAVSVVLPQETGFKWIPSAYAVDVENDVNLLLPTPNEFIKDEQNRVGLPSGDFLYEIVPAVVTNIMYAVGFLIFVAFIYSGTIIVSGRGNEEAVSNAKGIITNAAIALGLLSLGYALIYGIATLNLQEDPNSSNDDLFLEDDF
jgi:hypothetical protein